MESIWQAFCTARVHNTVLRIVDGDRESIGRVGGGLFATADDPSRSQRSSLKGLRMLGVFRVSLNYNVMCCAQWPGRAR